jgi:ADP-ribosylglycohydrolase
MLGAIIGDVAGSGYEFGEVRFAKEWSPSDIPLAYQSSIFTDDTVMTIATASVLIANDFKTNGVYGYDAAYRYMGNAHPDRGYGGRFARWLLDASMGPYNSFGNGSAMRVSPIGFAFDTEEEVLTEARRSAMVSHDHPEGIKGAQATALAILMARKGCTKEQIKNRIVSSFGYNLDRTVAQIKPGYKFDETCQGSVPEAITCFLESDSYESAIRNAIYLKGDTDTQACIAGGIAEAFYKDIPQRLVQASLPKLDDFFINIINEFYQHVSGLPENKYWL